ncbi:TetR/AcrR family transcriptional regulator [Streptomyces sp. M19]
MSYHEIAREAGVGVGTVYRRYPERDQLMAAVLSDILAELIATGHQALDRDDAWEGFSLLFTGLAVRTAQNTDCPTPWTSTAGPPSPSSAANSSTSPKGSSSAPRARAPAPGSHLAGRAATDGRRGGAGVRTGT